MAYLLSLEHDDYERWAGFGRGLFQDSIAACTSWDWGNLRRTSWPVTRSRFEASTSRTSLLDQDTQHSNYLRLCSISVTGGSEMVGTRWRKTKPAELFCPPLIPRNMNTSCSRRCVLWSQGRLRSLIGSWAGRLRSNKWLECLQRSKVMCRAYWCGVLAPK
jgi:hypothetical protein